jgi:hypothetical protein
MQYGESICMGFGKTRKSQVVPRDLRQLAMAPGCVAVAG